MNYRIQDREAGNVISEFATFEDARKKLKEYEDSDKLEGIFENNWYQIYQLFGDEWVLIQW
jgi:hypothetical protein